MVYHPLTEEKSQVFRHETVHESSNVVNGRAGCTKNDWHKRIAMTPVRILMAVLLLAMAGAGAGVVIFTLTRPADDAAGAVRIVPVTIEGLRLSVPAGYFRSGVVPRGAMAERIDLVFEFPDMKPVASRSPVSGHQEQLHQRQVFMAIMRSDGVIDPAERPQELYGRFLEPDVWDNPGGLMMRRFAPDSPYSDEELFLAPPDGRRFSARCRKPVKAAEDIGEACLWRFRQAGADVQVRFTPDLLTQWEVLEGGVKRLLVAWAGR
jgi:hypothetical protein